MSEQSTQAKKKRKVQEIDENGKVICNTCYKHLDKSKFTKANISCNGCANPTGPKQCKGKCNQLLPIEAFTRPRDPRCTDCTLGKELEKTCYWCEETKSRHDFDAGYASCKECVLKYKIHEQDCKDCDETFTTKQIQDVRCPTCRLKEKKRRNIRDPETRLKELKDAGDRICRFCEKIKTWDSYQCPDHKKCKACIKSISDLKHQENEVYEEYVKRKCTRCNCFLAEPLFYGEEYVTCTFCIAASCIQYNYRECCEHGRQTSQCRECPNPIGLCQTHGRLHYRCYECNPESVAFCECKRLKYTCFLHASESRCIHGTNKRHCQECNPPGYIASQVHAEIINTIKLKDLTKERKYLKCTGYEFRDHIEKHFKEGMTWGNHGVWQIDHVVPLMHKKPTSADVVARAVLSNIRPKWAYENAKKGWYHTDGNDDIRG
jgi:hypothetical protein